MRVIVIGVVAAALGAALALAAAAEEEGYTYTLVVKNRELTTENVDVSVFVDRAPAAREQLRPGDVEDVLKIALALEPGPHRILIQAVKGTDRLEQELVVSAEGSADVDIWFEPVIETWPPVQANEPPGDIGRPPTVAVP